MPDKKDESAVIEPAKPGEEATQESSDGAKAVVEENKEVIAEAGAGEADAAEPKKEEDKAEVKDEGD